MNHPGPALTVCGLDDLLACGAGAFTHAISILDPGCPKPETLAAFAPSRCLSLRFHDAIEPDGGRSVPGYDDIARVLHFGASLDWKAVDTSSAHLVVQCEMGISRSTAVLAILLAQAYPGEAGHHLFEKVELVQPRAWPNSRIVQLGDDLLGRGGRLVSALGSLYRRQLVTRPHMRALMSQHGRVHELELADRPLR